MHAAGWRVCSPKLNSSSFCDLRLVVTLRKSRAQLRIVFGPKEHKIAERDSSLCGQMIFKFIINVIIA